MWRRVPWLLLVVALLGCDDDRLVTDADRARAAATGLFDTLDLPGATAVELPAIVGDGPRITRICGTTQFVPGEPVVFAGRVVGGRPDAIVFTDRFVAHGLRVPISVDDEGRFTVSGALGSIRRVPESMQLHVGAEVAGGVARGVPLNISVARAGQPGIDACTYAGAGLTTAMAFGGPADRFMVTGSSSGRLEVWDLETGTRRLSLPAVDGRIRAVAIGPDGNSVAAGGPQGTLTAWNVEGETLVQPVALHAGPITAIELSLQSGWLATASWDGTVRVYAFESGALPPPVDVGDRVEALAFSPDGQHLAAVAGTLAGPGRLLIWRVADGALEPVVDTPLAGNGTAVAFAGPDAVVAAHGLGGLVRVALDGTVDEMSDAPDDLAAGLAVLGEAEPFVILASYDGRLAVGLVGGVMQTIARLSILVESMALSPGGHWLAAALLDGGIRVVSLSAVEL